MTRAGKSTLNRLKLTGAEFEEKARYKKIGLDFAAVDQLLGEILVQAHDAPKRYRSSGSGSPP